MMVRGTTLDLRMAAVVEYLDAIIAHPPDGFADEIEAIRANQRKLLIMLGISDREDMPLVRAVPENYFGSPLMVAAQMVPNPEADQLWRRAADKLLERYGPMFANAPADWRARYFEPLLDALRAP